ncbi:MULTISPECIES: hypothetical protein [Haloferax]|uniref:Major facilitator superfamily (MFS) profile domain-containing protein n=2 Tax=Haloferax TaxID=2251 RepID=A0A6G1Z0N9_9EURY|nr:MULTISPECIES: hypothetical protein [Haloferax]KAB1187360.1 hypothetical protein Hfx1149_04690 [Haloferax sp. CBA1149]MRW80008.1 hypothetical protein [Haloferax marinisediminis]
MSLRTIAGDTAFRYLMVAGILVGLLNLVIGYVETGKTDIVGFVGFVVLVAIVGALLVTYWGSVEQRADAE